MKKSTCKLLSILITITFAFSILSAYAVALVQDHSGFAAYINGNINLSGTNLIEGDTVSVQGDVNLTNNDASNKIDGVLYISEDANLTCKYNNHKQKEQITGGVVRGSDKTYSNNSHELPEAPQLDNYGSFESKWGDEVDVISKSGAYDTFKITGPVTFETNDDDLIIAADKFIFNGDNPDISGNGRLIIFANKIYVNNSFVFDHNSDRDRVHIFVKTGNFDVNNFIKLTANLYIEQGSINFNSSGSEINGNIVVGGSYANIFNHTKIYGVVFAPNAAADLRSSAYIEGSLLADSLTMAGDSKIIYHNYSISIPEISDPTPTPTPTSTPTPTPDPIDDIPDGPPVVLNFPYAYLYGYSDGLAAPDEHIKRQEAAALIYRLLKQNDKLQGFIRPESPTYSDLPSDDWSYSALEYMTYIEAYKNLDTILPWADISRGEVAKIIAFSLRIRPDSSSTISYSDMEEDHPFYIYVKALVDNDYFIGYNDDTIRPDDFMTRAEFVTMLNRIIGRDESYYIEDIECPYPDLEGHWSYPYMMRASFGFTDEPNEDGYYTQDPSRKVDRSLIDYD